MPTIDYTTPAEALTAIQDYFHDLNDDRAEFRAWAGGTADGGPGLDGDYPLTDHLDVVHLVPCPAKIAETVEATMAGLQALCYATWAALDAVTGPVDLMIAAVKGDAGTHLDPVSESTVNNSGLYRWDDAEGAWTHFADFPLMVDTDEELTADSDTRVASQKAVKTYISDQLLGLFDLKGSIDCSASPMFPAALKGDAYVVSDAGLIGGGLGQYVRDNTLLVARIDNAGGNFATAGVDWYIIGNAEDDGPSPIVIDDDEPVSAAEGDLWWNTVDEVLNIYIDAAWVVAGGGGGFPDIAGNSLKVLRVKVGEDDVEWATPSAGYTDEEARDAIAATLVAGAGIGITVDDGGDTITIVSTQTGPPFRGALVRKAADQTAANYTSATVLAWDQEVYDNDAIHNNVTNNSRLTVPADATKVRIGLRVKTDLNTADTYQSCHIQKNGSASYDGATGQNSEMGLTTPAIVIWTPVLPVTGGDYFQGFFQTESDASITIDAAGSWFAMEIIETTPGANVTSQAGTSYTAVLADADKYIYFTAVTAIAFTIPPNASVAFPIGTVISFEQAAAGTVTVTAGAGVTLNSRAGAVLTAGQYAVGQAKKVATNTWTLIGDLA